MPISLKHFLKVHEFKKWPIYMRGHAIEFPSGKVKYILTFKGHEQYECLVSPKTYNKLNLNKGGN